MSEIDYLKNNISKSYLKNIYNIIFYNKKNQLILEIYFMEKYLLLMLNDFIEISLKMLLEYENIIEKITLIL